MATAVEIGGRDDALRIKLGGTDVIIAEQYALNVSVFQQPAAFTLRLGTGSTFIHSDPNRQRPAQQMGLARDLLKLALPGTPFELRIGPGDGVVVQTGRIDSASVPNASYTQVELRGRDYMAQLFDSFFDAERSFSEKTYYELTRTVLDMAGLTAAKGHQLEPTNDNNRALTTGVTTTTKGAEELVRELETGAKAGTGKLVYKTLVAKLGTRLFDFLQNQYRLSGLFLWATGEGNFSLCRPRTDQPPGFKLVRTERGMQSRSQSRVIDASFSNDTTQRHSKAIVYGRAGGGVAGKKKIRGEFIDQEMVAYGFDKPIIIHDDDAKSQRQADYLARRMIAEERRHAWKLEYTVAGHTVPSATARGSTAIWGPDTMCSVQDEELGISGGYYVSEITFSRSPQTTTRISLMRPEDLVFAEGPP